LKPGPRFGEILEAVETRQLEGALRDREEALAWVKEFLTADYADDSDKS
jgi:poly(A) polymerase